MENILNEILSWKDILKNHKKSRYDLKPIENHFSSFEKYKLSFENMFYEELKSQFKRILEISLNKEKILSARVLWSGIRNKKFIINAILVNGLLKESDSKRLALVISKKKINQKQKSKKAFAIIRRNLTNNKILLLEINFLWWKEFKEKNQIFKIILFKQTSGFLGLVREFEALNSFKNIGSQIGQIILSPRQDVSIFGGLKVDLLDKFHLRHHFNGSQIKAIISFLKYDITLIQGPPGTGKTRTILGIISLINITQKNFFGKFISAKLFPEKIIVCAPSNAAIDENVMRSIQGFTFISNFFR